MKNKNSKIADTLITGVGVLFVSKIVVQGNIFKLNRWRKKEEHGQKSSRVPFDCILLCYAATTLEHENEPSPEVFQEAMVYSRVEVIVSITDDIPLLSWMSQFAKRFLNKDENWSWIK